MPTLRSSATPPTARRRRRLLPIVDAAFQWKYTVLIMLLGAGTAAAMAVFLYRAHAATTRLLSLQEGALADQVARGDRQLLLYLVAAVALLALALGAWGLVVTHRISGPMYLLARYCDVIAHGHYPDVRPLREHDELQQAFARFADAVSALRARDVAALGRLERALQQTQRTDGAAASPAALRTALEAAVGCLEAERQEVARALGHSDGVVVG